VPSKELVLHAIVYGNVYVAQVAMGAEPQQTLQAFREAEAYDGPSIMIAFSHCIAHGIEMRHGLDQQYRAAASGHWPLLQQHPCPGVRHHTMAVRGHLHPRNRCDTLHLRSAFLSALRNRREVPFCLAGQALSLIHTPRPRQFRAESRLGYW